MRIGSGGHAVDKRHFIHMLGHVRQHAGNHFSALARRNKCPRRSHQIPVLALKGDFLFTPRHWSVVKFFQHRLVIPQVDVRSASRAEYL